MHLRSLIPAIVLAFLALLPGHARAEWQTIQCSGGNDVMVGLNAFAGAWTDRIQVICATWDPAARRLVPSADNAGHQWAGGSGGGPVAPAQCPPGSAVVGIKGLLAHRVDNDVAELLTLKCASVTGGHGPVNAAPVIVTTDNATNLPPNAFAGSALPNLAGIGHALSAPCPGQVAWGLSANVAQFVGYIQIKCKAWPDTGAATSAAPGLKLNGKPSNTGIFKSVTGLLSAPSGAEINTDRPGNDVQALQSANAADCQAKCAANANCAAWTWTKPGTNGMAASVCFMKRPAPPPQANACCTSGVK
jgi:hypothetical protein